MASIKEKCAVFGAYIPGSDVARITHAGLWSLQHRGQEGTGIAVSNGKTIAIKKNLGLVTQVYTESDIQNLVGDIAVGHNRYSTNGGSILEHVQPVMRPDKKIALAHNGNLPDTTELKTFLNSLGVSTDYSNDSEMIADAITYYLVKGKSVGAAVKKVFPHLVGAFSIVLMTKDTLVAFRDQYGIRPLCMGTLHSGYVFASESCALSVIGAEYKTELKPGEMVIISMKNKKLKKRSYQLAPPKGKLDIFEFVYFARADSLLLGKRVNEVRRNFGKELAREAPVKNADVIVAVPDSAFPAAEGFSEISGVLVQNGFIKNGYVHRTFIRPEQLSREKHLKMKLNPIPEVLSGKSVVLIDDSIVRGTTTKRLVALIRKAGAKEVHVRISAPPVLYPDYYGIDTPAQHELIAATKSIPEIKRFIQADSLAYLSYKGLIKATGLPERVFCTSCFSGKYPISIGKYSKEIKKKII
jgi:amidophosphoribosyltransferase